MDGFRKDIQYYKFCAYGFLKNLRFFEPFLILFFLEGNLSYLQIGIIYTIREVIRNIFEIPSGLAADVLGRRRTMITSFSLYIISFLIYSISYRYGMLITATIVFALGDAFRTGTHKAMIFDYLDRRDWNSHKVSYYGHTRSWSQAGSAVSALMAAAMIFYTGRISQVFLYSVIPYALGLLLILSYPAYLDGDAPGFRKSNLNTALRATIGNFWYSFKQARVFRGILNVSVYGGYYRAVKDYIQPLIQAAALSLPVLVSLQSEQKTAVLVGIIYFLIYLMSSAVTRQSGRFSKRLQGLSGLLNLTLIAGLMLGTMTGFFYLAGFTLLSIILFTGIYLVQNLRIPAGIAYFTENLDKDILATTLSAESQSKSMFTAVIALMLGFLADRFDIGTAILACSAFMLLTTPLYLLKKRRDAADY
jgi:MFS family permease